MSEIFIQFSPKCAIKMVWFDSLVVSVKVAEWRKTKTVLVNHCLELTPLIVSECHGVCSNWRF